jgi:N-dimethylarginine dimethylaminohydrolase
LCCENGNCEYAEKIHGGFRWQKREQEGKAAWGKWVQDNAKSIVDIGSPLGKTKRTDMHGISDIRNALAAYTVVQAESHEAAAKLFQNHPHFMIFPGDAVEIMECLPIPQ